MSRRRTEGIRMSAERTPHPQSVFAAPLERLTACVLAHPRATISGGIVLALVAIVVTIMGLGFHTSRLDLLNPESSWNQRWLAYLQEFGNEDDVVVVVDGPDRATVIAAVDDLAEVFTSESRYFSSVFHKVELGRVRAKGLYLVPDDELVQLESFVGQAEPVLRGDWRQLTVENQLERIQFALAQLPPQAPERVQLMEQLQRLAHSMRGLCVNDAEYISPWPSRQTTTHDYDQLQDQHFLADEGRLGIVLLKLAGPAATAQATPIGPAVTRLRELLASAEMRNPAVTIGVTGMPILEHDEMQTSQADMTKTGLISLVGVAICFGAAFGGWRHMLLAMAALLLSMAVAFGFVTLSVGHLNLLSVSFASVLIGQGIDFGIHYVAAYLRIRPQAESCTAALRQVSRTVGPGIFTGGLTTAIAFCMALLTDFTGLCELGIIAGGGILICTIGALVLLPPLIRTVDGHRPVEQLPRIVPLRFLIAPVHWWPRLTLAIVIVLTIACGCGLPGLRYDHNLLNLQPRGIASVELEHALIDRADKSVWFALSMSHSRDEIRARKARFEQLSTVSHTEEIVSLLPEVDPSKTQAVSDIRRVLALLPELVPQLPAGDAPRVAQLLSQLLRILPEDGAAWRDEAQQAATTIAALEAGAASRRLSLFQQQAAVELVDRLKELREFADPLAPRLEDLPRPLAERFTGKTGQYLLKVYAAGNVWDIENLQQFVNDVESVDEQITGHPIQTYYASKQMQQSYLQAGVYAFVAMLIAVLIDLRRVRLSLLSVLPMLLGLVQTFGLLGWLGIPLNAANLIVLPLIFGIGIDDGVHLMHDRLTQRGRYRLNNATFVAVLLTSVTTMVGFGSLMLAQHQGLRSLGQVLTLGVLCCLISSTMVLPAWFVLRTRRLEPVDEVAADAPLVPTELDILPTPMLAPAGLNESTNSTEMADLLAGSTNRPRVAPRRAG
jgi:hopanoid biosynthesis associated RND transporter like protein HpnN